MKNKFVLAAIGLSALALPFVSLAAGINLYNGGFGQLAGNTDSFGIAVCNGGTAAVNQSVPVSISVGGQTATVASVASIAAKACAYSYSQYATLGMQPGQTYSVVATIDPTKSVISNANNQATYSITVPGTAASAAGTQPTTAGATNGSNGTAEVNAQSGNIFTAIWGWFMGLFGK